MFRSEVTKKGSGMVDRRRRTRPQYDWEKVRQWLLAEERRQGYSGTEFARKLRMSQGMYSHIVTGARRPGRDSLAAICDYFNVSISEFYLPEEEKHEMVLLVEKIIKSPRTETDLRYLMDAIHKLLELAEEKLEEKRGELLNQ